MIEPSQLHGTQFPLLLKLNGWVNPDAQSIDFLRMEHKGLQLTFFFLIRFCMCAILSYLLYSIKPCLFHTLFPYFQRLCPSLKFCPHRVFEFGTPCFRIRDYWSFPLKMLTSGCHLSALTRHEERPDFKKVEASIRSYNSSISPHASPEGAAAAAVPVK